jgi:hypothetical protein
MAVRMNDPRIDRRNVLSTIYASRNHRRVIWTPSTTLAVMRIERYPHDPPDKLHQMKKILAALCAEGLMIKRPHIHVRYTLKEVAYERIEPLERS